MPKHPWKSIDNHIDPEKEEQLKWIKIEVESQVKRVIKLTKSINNGNKEKNAKTKSEAINIVEDFQKQYGALYSLYEDLREQVKKNIKASRGNGDNNSPSSACNSDSESFHSLKGSNPPMSSSDSNEPADQTSDSEDTVLKDKLTSSSEVTNLDSSLSESGETLYDLRVQEGESENTTNQETARVKYLEARVQSLKLKVSTLSVEKGELKQQAERKTVEAMRMKDKTLRLKARVSEIESRLKENERRFYSVQQFEESEKKYMSRISELVTQADDMQIELDTLRSQKAESEGRYLNEAVRSSSQLKGLMEHVDSLKGDLANANRHNAQLKSGLEKESDEKSSCLTVIERLRKELSLNQQLLTEEREGLKTQVHGLESKIRSLISTQSELQMQLDKSKNEASQSHGLISELQKSVSGKENELSMERRKFVDFQNLMSTKTKSQAEEFKNLENEKGHFKRVIESLKTDKNRLQTDLSKEKEESSISKSLVEKISKSNFQAVEKKVEEMLAEYRKQLDDKYRILSRRIRVAEQLHGENKEWYRITKEAYEQQNKDLKIRAERNEIELRNIKDMTLAANDVLNSLDSVGLNFKQSSANFLNRISKASCELKFAKHWAMRKNKAILHVKDDLDCLLSQLDDKEAEILVFREKVWKSENKVRELEKIIKEKEDGMLGLKEEKREAIRQLCVWIDYHRGRSEFYMKMLSDGSPARKRA